MSEPQGSIDRPQKIPTAELKLRNRIAWDKWGRYYGQLDDGQKAWVQERMKDPQDQTQAEELRIYLEDKVTLLNDSIAKQPATRRKRIEMEVGDLMYHFDQYANQRALELLDKVESYARRADECTGDTLVVKTKFINSERLNLTKKEGKHE